MQFKAQRKYGMRYQQRGKDITYDWGPVIKEDVTFEMGLPG